MNFEEMQKLSLCNLPYNLFCNPCEDLILTINSKMKKTKDKGEVAHHPYFQRDIW